MDVTEKSAYFVRTSIGTEIKIMHRLTCLRDTEAQPNSISKYVMSADWFFKICQELYNRQFYLR